MNLGQILARVETETQYAPELEAHRADFRQVINRVYQTLATSRRWPWLRRTAPIWQLPDMDIASGVGGVTKTVGSGGRTLDVVRSALRTSLGFTSNQQFTVFLQLQMVGGTLDIANGDRTVGNGTWERAPFYIENLTPLQVDAGGTAITFYLDPRCDITTFVGDEGNLRFSFPRIQLPPDLDSLEAIRDDQGADLRCVTAAEERMFLRTTGPGSNTNGGGPAYVLEDQGFVPNQGFYLVQATTDGGAPYEHSAFLNNRENWALRETIACTSPNPTSGSMISGTKVKVFCCWWWGNRFGSPSNVVEYTVDDFLGVKVVGIPSLPQTTGTFEYGRRVAVFMAEGEGAFFFRGFVTSPTATTYNILTPNTSGAGADVGLRFPRYDEIVPPSYQYVRMWPRPADVTRFEIDYWARPRVLAEDLDRPEFHEPLHELLVWLACVDLAGRFGPEAALKRFQFLRDNCQQQLETRYFPQERHAGGRQKGMIGKPSSTKPWQTIDWHGDS